MSTACYTIVGGDYTRGGSASSSLKELFKRVGAEPQALRRAVIAAYEAEMNVVIHARKGQMLVRFQGNQVDVEVHDEGPGIPDLELAMQEGYSTAPAAARELGFGAGMGLPNIKKYSDSFSIESTIGAGTRVRFSVVMRPPEGVWWERNSIRIVSEPCAQCLRCLQACPTSAVRVHGGGPQVLWHLCIDCTSCVGVCPTGAISMDVPNALPDPRGATVIVPSAFAAQFGDACPVEGVLEAFRELGFGGVALSAPAERALRAAVIAWGRSEAPARPAISPVCPAVVNLVQVCFPSLIPHVAPFLSPMEATASALGGGRRVVVAVCPAECTSATHLEGDVPAALASPRAMRLALAPLVLRKSASGRGDRAGAPVRRVSRRDGLLRAYGIQRVMALLDRIENGLCADVPVVEPYACELGCFGSPLLWEHPFVARHRWRGAAARLEQGGIAVPRKAPLEARQGVRLDQDMGRAIAKLAEIEKLAASLPGRNCSMCGSPNCATFAEDVVLGRAKVTGCPNFACPREDQQ